MNVLQLKLIIKATEIRLSRGEKILDIIDSYSVLKSEEKQSILNFFSSKEVF